MKMKVSKVNPEQVLDLVRMADLETFQPWAAKAIRKIAGILPGKRRNYNSEGLDPYDNFQTVAAIKELLYRGLPSRELTPADAILDHIIHKIVRLVRGSEWDEQVGESVSDSATDLHGYVALLHGYFIRRSEEK